MPDVFSVMYKPKYIANIKPCQDSSFVQSDMVIFRVRKELNSHYFWS